MTDYALERLQNDVDALLASYGDADRKAAMDAIVRATPFHEAKLRPDAVVMAPQDYQTARNFIFSVRA